MGEKSEIISKIYLSSSLDQYEALTELLEELSANDYHVVLITHYLFFEVLMNFPNVLKYCNLIIDGKYEQDKRIFETNKKPGIYHVIGSSNQRIWHRDDNIWYDVTDKDDLMEYYCL